MSDFFSQDWCKPTPQADWFHLETGWNVGIENYGVKATECARLPASPDADMMNKHRLVCDDSTENIEHLGHMHAPEVLTKALRRGVGVSSVIPLGNSYQETWSYEITRFGWSCGGNEIIMLQIFAVVAVDWVAFCLDIPATTTWSSLFCVSFRFFETSLMKQHYIITWVSQTVCVAESASRHRSCAVHLAD